jgi:hypothetical protein
VKKISLFEDDLYFTSDEARGREHLLESLVANARQLSWHGDFHNEWRAHDIELIGDSLHNISLKTATEELGWPKRFTRVRCHVRPSGLAILTISMVSAWIVLSLLSGLLTPMLVALPLYLATIGWFCFSRARCRRAVQRLVYLAGEHAGLRPVRLGRYDSPVEQLKLKTAGKQEDAEACLA